ncbi:LysR family transcriptional regulator [Acidovorax sp. ACV02]|uniref:LysR family transcriptional regulator n=1 Tax=Acidovorax sp. ACV02 TaxID=2769310 RepID=UPI00177C2955|nr:LysR family transcriptional regulator [Acidovorax sp. ACV02]MBD9405216.1 LysR family transcriptional regulator [Acidovorax sp. ACV02]
MRNLNLDQLQTLIAIADLGTFAAAAQALHLAPPTVSMHIKELESRLGAELVVRGRRQADLTPAGEVLVREGRQLLLASDDLVERVRRHASGREGMVRVGVSAGVSTRLLPRMLEALAARSPGVEIRLEAVGSAESMQRLKAGTLDIAIVASPQPPLAEVKQTPWRNDPMVALLPAAWDAPDRIGPDWLASRRWASFAPATQMHGLIANWFGQAGHHPRPFLALSYPGALKSLAVASQCAALLPMEEVEDLQGTPDVQIRPLQPPLMRPMAVAHRHQPPPSPAVEGVLELLADFADFAE